MRRLTLLILAIIALALAVFVWPTRWRYDHITVESDRYLVRIERLTGRTEILVPELGWTPAEQPWDENAAPGDDRHTLAEPL